MCYSYPIKNASLRAVRPTIELTFCKATPKPVQVKPTKTAQNWGKMIKSQERESTLSLKFGKERGGTEGEGGEDDIGYSSDNEGVDNEWTNLVNRTIAMVFEEV